MIKSNHRAICTETYTKVIPADTMVDQHGNALCDVPAYEFHYTEGQSAGFRTKAARDAFVKANPGKWRAL